MKKKILHVFPCQLTMFKSNEFSNLEFYFKKKTDTVNMWKVFKNRIFKNCFKELKYTFSPGISNIVSRQGISFSKNRDMYVIFNGPLSRTQVYSPSQSFNSALGKKTQLLHVTMCENIKSPL